MDASIHHESDDVLLFPFGRRVLTGEQGERALSKRGGEESRRRSSCAEEATLQQQQHILKGNVISLLSRTEKSWEAMAV